jgi:acetyl esterase/lipase
MYGGGRDRRDPQLSPLFADLAGLPPLLIQAGGAEMLLDDSRRFAVRAREAGVDVQLAIYPHMVHVWHFTWRLEAQARQALAEIGQFVRERAAV